MKIEQVSIRKIKKSAFFKRKHDAEQIQLCCLSLKRHGQYQPIIVSEGQILCGNLIYQSAKKLGWKKVQIYNLGKLSQQKKKQIRFLDNHTFDLSSWKEEQLKQLLMSIQTCDIQNFGFTQQQAYVFINDLNDQDITISQMQKDLDVDDIYFCRQCGWQGTLKEIKNDQC